MKRSDAQELEVAVKSFHESLAHQAQARHVFLIDTMIAIKQFEALVQLVKQRPGESPEEAKQRAAILAARIPDPETTIAALASDGLHLMDDSPEALQAIPSMLSAWMNLFGQTQRENDATGTKHRED